MSNSDHDDQSATADPSDDRVGVPDEQLPEDLQPSADNPLAEGLEPGETVEELLEGGKPAEQGEDSGADDDGEPPTGATEAARI